METHKVRAVLKYQVSTDSNRKFEVRTTPTTPDLALTDFCLFPRLKQYWGHKFTICTANDWLEKCYYSVHQLHETMLKFEKR